MAIMTADTTTNLVERSSMKEFYPSTKVAEMGIQQTEFVQSHPHDYASSLLPAGAYDTHVHVFDPRIGPYSPTRAYTPERASYSSLIAFSKTLSATHPNTCASFVLVQPSPYKTDNRVLLHLLKQSRDAGLTARGIAVVDVESVTEQELRAMHALGVRGLRLNMQADGKRIDVNALATMLRQAADRIAIMPGWKLQIYAPAYIWTDLHSIVMKLPVPVIADHIGGLQGASKLPLEHYNNPTRQSGFDALVSLAKASRVFIKISGLYRASDETQNGFEDLEPIIRRLAADVPQQLIWGSDWPHTGEGKDRARQKDIETTEQFRIIDNITILKNLRQWVGSEEVWKKMMVDTPREVFV